MGNCVCSCSFNHAGYVTSYDEVTLKEKVIVESPRKLGANFLGTLHVVPQGHGHRTGSGKLLLTPGFLHCWLVMSTVYFRQGGRVHHITHPLPVPLVTTACIPPTRT